MHIADGLLPIGVSLAADAATLAGVWAGGRKLTPREIPRMGIFAALLFTASLIHLPVAGTSIHLGLYGLAGIILGVRSFPVVFVSLIFQCLIFQHGGLLSLGVNTLTMGSGSLLAGLLWSHLPLSSRMRGFICGLAGIFFPAWLISLLFLLLGYGRGMLFLLGLYLPVAIIEGVLTGVIVHYFLKVQPEILKR